MVHKCAICGEYQPSLMSYQMHQELMHRIAVIQTHKGRFLTKIEKALIVVKGEARLGQEHFI